MGFAHNLHTSRQEKLKCTLTVGSLGPAGGVCGTGGPKAVRGYVRLERTLCVRNEIVLPSLGVTL